MSDEEKADLLDTIGETILESAVLKYAISREKEEVKKFEEFLEKNENNDGLLEEIFKRFPEFETILEEEVTAFKKEATEVLDS